MAYDEKLLDRIQTVLKGKRGIQEKKMFGGVCILLNGNMAVGVSDDRVMVRVGPDQYEKCLQMKHVKPMDFTGRPLKGLIWVSADGVKTKAALTRWLDRGLDFARSLPPK